MPSTATLSTRATRNQPSNFLPTLGTVRSYRIPQLHVCVFCPFARKRRVYVGDRMPSTATFVSVRPGTSAVIAFQFLPSCSPTASFNVLSSSAVHLPARAVVGSMLETKVSHHLLRHCFCVRPGTRTAIAFQFLPPCSPTTFFNFVSSFAVHLPASAVVGSMSETASHLLRH
jgi:hypothetical protein